MNSFSLSVRKDHCLYSLRRDTHFSVAYLSVMPLPENDLISGNCACNAGSKFEASTTSNCSICPSALGREIVVECLAALLTTWNNSFCKGVYSNQII